MAAASPEPRMLTVGVGTVAARATLAGVTLALAVTIGVVTVAARATGARAGSAFAAVIGVGIVRALVVTASVTFASA